MHHPTDRITHTTAFVTPVVEHWLEQEMAQWVGFEIPLSWSFYMFDFPVQALEVPDYSRHC